MRLQASIPQTASPFTRDIHRSLACSRNKSFTCAQAGHRTSNLTKITPCPIAFSAIFSLLPSYIFGPCFKCSILVQCLYLRFREYNAPICTFLRLLIPRSIMHTRLVLLQRGPRHWYPVTKHAERYRRNLARSSCTCGAPISRRRRRRRRSFLQGNKSARQLKHNKMSMSSILGDIVQLAIARGLPAIRQSVQQRVRRLLISSTSLHN